MQVCSFNKCSQQYYKVLYEYLSDNVCNLDGALFGSLVAVGGFFLFTFHHMFDSVTANKLFYHLRDMFSDFLFTPVVSSFLFTPKMLLRICNILQIYGCKNENFRMIFCTNNFSYVCCKRRLWVLVVIVVALTCIRKLY